MHAYLVLASGVEREVGKRVVITPSQHLVVGHRHPAFIRIVGGIDHKLRILGQTAFDIPSVLLEITLEHGHIKTLQNDVVPIVTEHLLRLFRFCEHHQSGRVAVKAMHHIQPICRVHIFHISLENLIRILFLLMALRAY